MTKFNSKTARISPCIIEIPIINFFSFKLLKFFERYRKIFLKIP